MRHAEILCELRHFEIKFAVIFFQRFENSLRLRQCSARDRIKWNDLFVLVHKFIARKSLARHVGYKPSRGGQFFVVMALSSVIQKALDLPFIISGFQKRRVQFVVAHRYRIGWRRHKQGGLPCALATSKHPNHTEFECLSEVDLHEFIVNRCPC